MAIANPFKLGELTDLTSQINIIPNHWGLINQLGIFRSEMKSQKTILVPRKTETVTILEDRNWNERNQAITGGSRDVLPLAIPHFPVDDMILPTDIDGKVDWDSLLQGGNAGLTLAPVRADKMTTMRNAHALTLEYARMQMLKDGTVYAPKGTVNTNFYTEFGLTRQTIFFNLASTVDNPLEHANTVIGTIQDGIHNGIIVSDIIALCSPEFFNALIQNPFVYESFQYFNQTQGTAILNQRLGTGRGLDGRYRLFEYGGVTFIECRGTVNGAPYVETGKAYAFPMGTDSFRTFYAPAERFGYVNTLAQESYYFEFPSQKMDKIEIETETNFLNTLLRPQTVITLDMAAS